MAGEIRNKAISASNEVEVEVKAELGKYDIVIVDVNFLAELCFMVQFISQNYNNSLSQTYC